MSSCRCECCRGTGVETPAEVFNPPARPEIGYRAGTHGQFLSSMLARLSSPAYPELDDLTVRTTDDPAIALLDSGAVLGDLLTFYTERVANEGYLRTATELGSLTHLGHLVGYRPRPGVAAGTYLAYTIDADPRTGGDLEVTIRRGSRAQSVPGPGQEPQPFETSDDLLARWAWNTLRVRERQPYQLDSAQLAQRRRLYLAGTANNVRPGDRLLVIFGGEPGLSDLVSIPGVEIDREAGVTTIELPREDLPSLRLLEGRFVKLVEEAHAHELYDRSRLVHRFVEKILEPIREGLDAIDVPAELAGWLAGALRRVDEAVALARRDDEVRSWFEGVRVALAELHFLATRLAPAQEPQESQESEPDLGENEGISLYRALGLAAGQRPPEEDPGNPALRGLGALLGRLRVPPTRPPRNARHLDREVANLYAAGSDIGPQLLAALNPRVRDGLYAAWRGVDVTEPLALRELQAMRIVANPFGATAPLRTRYDEQGRPSGTIEWPLGGSQVLTMRVAYEGDTPVRAELSFTEEGGQAWRDELDLTGDGLHDFGPGQVEVTVHEPPPPEGEGQGSQGGAPSGQGSAGGQATAPQQGPVSEQGTAAEQEDSGLWSTIVGAFTGDEGDQAQQSQQAQGDQAQTQQARPDQSGEGGQSGRADRVAVPPQPEQEPGVTIRFLADLPERSVFCSRAATAEPVHLLIENGAPVEMRVAVGDNRRAQHHQAQVTVRRQEGESSTSSVLDLSFERSFAALSRNVLPLDAVYQGITRGSWVVVDRPRKGADPSQGGIPGSEELARVVTRVQEARTVARAAFGITGKVTELVLADPWLDEHDTLLSHIRDTTVYAGGESLRLAEEPVTDDVGGSEIELDQLYDGLRPGRWIVVTGERTDIPGTAGVRDSELAMIAGVRQGVDVQRPGEAVHTTITLATPLHYQYKRDTVRIHGNVVHATHGVTRDDPIGSGDASKANQTFHLWDGPVTWLPDDNPRGATSTLEVRVDGVRWHEVRSLAGRGGDERVYVTGTGEDGLTTVTFGDGVHGARLPTGHENVRAHYRVGIGEAGNVDAGQITQITSRSLGVATVTNPLPATGGADPDDEGPHRVRRTRRRVPLAVSALDRLVSVPDYEDFALSHAGIGRAGAQRLFDGNREIVHVTVAGVDDIALTHHSDVVESLHASLAAYGDPWLPVDVAVRELVLLVLAAEIRVRPDHEWDRVEPAVRAALLDRLGFASRTLGQPAYLSEVIATAQEVPGVDYVDVNVFTGVPGTLTPADLEDIAARLDTPNPAVPARPATYSEERYTVTAAAGEALTSVAARHGLSVAELLALNPDISTFDRLPEGRSVVVFDGIRPAQLVLLSAAVPDTLILEEAQ